MKLQQILKFHLIPNRYVIQMSPVRTGSTFVYNVLREVVPGRVVEKHHTYHPSFKRVSVVATVRHPGDAIASICRVNKMEISDESVRRAAGMFLRNGAADVTRIKDRDGVLVLKYEDFAIEPEGLYDALEDFFDIVLDADFRGRLTERFGIDRARQISQKEGGFERWDEATMIHGDHVSKHANVVGYSDALFSDGQKEIIAELCSAYGAAFNYRF